MTTSKIDFGEFAGMSKDELLKLYYSGCAKGGALELLIKLLLLLGLIKP